MQTSLEIKDLDTFGEEYEFENKDNKSTIEANNSAQQNYVNSFLDQQNNDQ